MVEMRVGNSMLFYINRVERSGYVLKSVKIDIEGLEMVMAIRNELPVQFENIITAVDALRDEIMSFKLGLEHRKITQGNTKGIYDTILRAVQQHYLWYLVGSSRL